MIPCCQLVAKCEGELTDLMHSVQLKGAKDPYNAFLICVHGKAALNLISIAGTYITIFYRSHTTMQLQEKEALMTKETMEQVYVLIMWSVQFYGKIIKFFWPMQNRI